MKDMQINSAALSNFMKRFHFVIFVVFIVLILSAAVLMLYNVAGKASGDGVIDQTGNNSYFDQTTIDRVEKLKTSDEPSTPLDLSKGRINPFSE